MTILAPRPLVPAAEPWSIATPEHWSLEGGTTGRHLQADHSRMLDVSVYFPSPLSTEPRDLEGITAMMGSLLTEATASRDAEVFGAACDRHAVSIWAAVDLDGLTVTLSVPFSHAAQGLDLLIEAVTDPAFAAADIERLIGLRLADIRMEMSEPGPTAQLAMHSILYSSDERASRPIGGSAEEVKRIDRDALLVRFREVVVLSSAVIVSAGPLDAGELRSLVEARLGGRASGQPRSAEDRAAMSLSPQREPAATVLVSRPGSPQGHLLLGAATIDRKDPDWAAALVASNILGDGLRSRLNYELREQKGYTYGARSAFQAGRAGGAFSIEMAVQGDVIGAALADTLRIVEEFRLGGPTAEEHARAVEAIVSQAPIRLETPSDLVRTILSGVASDLPPTWFGDILRDVAATTPEDVRTAVQRILPEALSVVIVGDSGECRSQLAAARITLDQEM